MTIRGSQGEVGADSAERRAEIDRRVHFEALVAIGQTKGEGGFDAESIDVSPQGMRLRTLYLPKLGEKLLCRFGALGTEIVAEGEVIWCNEEARGGEFGLRFSELDATTTERLQAMCAALSGDKESMPEIARGTRVRLHIEGLGSPMKARVRKATENEIQVGSNLDFLRVGRPLEVENIEHGDKHGAVVEEVRIEVDPVSNVPQLVVSLQYEKHASPQDSSQPTSESASSAEAPDAVGVGAPPDQVQTLSSDAVGENENDGQPFRTKTAEFAQQGIAALGKIGPKLVDVGSKTRGRISELMSQIRQKRAEARNASGPRRTTAPPPGGALKSEGRRLVREDASANRDEVVPTNVAMPKKAALIGAGVGLASVLALVAITRSNNADPRGNEVAAKDSSAEVSTGSAQAGIPTGEGVGPITANVPLYGPTPLSTVEVVPQPTVAMPALAIVGAPSAPGASPGSALDPSLSPAIDSRSEDATDEDRDDEVKKEFGKGRVVNPVVLKLRMDGPIGEVIGAAGATGFTVSVPERRTLSDVEELARKDKRIASIDVSNRSSGSEITVQFKNGIPAYRVRGNGERLEIALSGESKKKVAAKSEKKHDRKAGKAKSKDKKEHGKKH